LPTPPFWLATAIILAMYPPFLHKWLCHLKDQYRIFFIDYNAFVWNKQ